MAKGKSSSGRNDARKNGKASKKKPGPAQPPKTNYDHINGRSSTSHAKREAWKAQGGRSYSVYCGNDCNHPNIPHWKTGVLHNAKALVKQRV